MTKVRLWARHAHAVVSIRRRHARPGAAQGNPEFSGNNYLKGKKVSIVVINPFFINSYGNACGDWLASPGCNPVYSNKNWIVMGAEHSISEGSYITTLKINLPAPGSDIHRDDIFGGPGSCGWKPPSGCKI